MLRSLNATVPTEGLLDLRFHCSSLVASSRCFSTSRGPAAAQRRLAAPSQAGNAEEQSGPATRGWSNSHADRPGCHSLDLSTVREQLVRFRPRRHEPGAATPAVQRTTTPTGTSRNSSVSVGSRSTTSPSAGGCNASRRSSRMLPARAATAGRRLRATTARALDTRTFTSSPARVPPRLPTRRSSCRATVPAARSAYSPRAARPASGPTPGLDSSPTQLLPPYTSRA